MIKSLIYNCQVNNLFIDIGDNIKIIYNNKIYYVKKEQLEQNFLSILNITYEWHKEYINLSEIDGINWNLEIIFKDNSRKEYYGHGSFPYNFNSFKSEIQKIIEKVVL